MGRVGSWGAAAAAAFALAACGDARVAQTPLAGQSDCASCHAAPGEAPPFHDQTGSTDPKKVSVGAHDAHLHPRFSAPVACGDCHRVPQRVNDPGHLEVQSPQESVPFGPLARTGGANPTYGQSGCQASYCHGNFAGGNRSNTPRWLAGSDDAQCGSCHAVPSPTGRHPQHFAAAVGCAQCHGPFVQATHVNGVVDVVLPAYDRRFKTCGQACHGPRAWPGEGDAAR